MATPKIEITFIFKRFDYLVVIIRNALGVM